MTYTRRQSGGFSLLEMLLAVAIFVMLMVGLVAIMRDYTEREIARSTSSYMTNVMDATLQILNNPTNFMALYYAASEAGGGYQLLADVDEPATNNILKTMVISTAAMGNTTIQRTSMLNENFRYDSPIRSQVRILLRTANPAGAPPALEVLVVTRTLRPFPLVQKAANEGAYQGGYLTDYTAKSGAVIRSAFNSWEVTPSARLSGTAWYTGDMPATLNVRTSGSLLAYYSYVNYAAVTSDYLFRTRDPDPTRALNTMYVPLDLNGNNILGADDVRIGNDGHGAAFASSPGIAAACSGSVLCVNGTAIIKGSAVIGGNMRVSGNAMVADSANVGHMRIENAMNDTNKLAYGAQGHLMVDGDGGGGGGGTNDLVNVANNALFEDGAAVNAAELGNITTVGMTMPPGGQLHTNTIGDAYKITGATIHASRMVAHGPMRVGVVTGGNVSLTSSNASARTGVIDISDMDNLRLGTTASPGTLTIQRLNVQRLSIDNFGTCNDCPR